MKKVAVAIALVLASIALVACGSSSSSSSSESTGSETTSESSGAAGGAESKSGEAEGGSAGSASTLDIEAASSGLAYTSKSATATAGKVTVDFNNPQPLAHDVAIENSSGEVVGQTELATEGESSDRGQPRTGHLQLLLHRPGPPRSRHGRHAHRQVVRWSRRPLLGGRHHPGDGSPTKHGFSLPSTSSVKRVTTCHQPPPISSTETTSAVARTFESTGTGAGKRILFQP